MPIKPENKARYPANWNTISEQIRERDNQKCCFCGVKNGASIIRLNKGGKHFYRYPESDNVYCAESGSWCTTITKGYNLEIGYFNSAHAKAVKIVLTVAHLDHTPENCDPSNLKSLCQRCHLKYDAAHHAQTRAQTKQKVADNQTSLF